MTTPTIYESLTTSVNILPEEDETEQDFYQRLKRSLDKDLSEEQFNELPEPAQDWTNDATEAVVNKVNIQVLPGSPWDIRNKSNGADATEAETAEKPKGRKGGREAAGGGKAQTGTGPKEKKSKATTSDKSGSEEATKRRGRRPSEDGEPGVLELLSDVMHDDPKQSAAQLQERASAKHEGVEFKPANCIGIRQQYRRWARFFARKGLMKEIDLD